MWWVIWWLFDIFDLQIWLTCSAYTYFDYRISSDSLCESIDEICWSLCFVILEFALLSLQLLVQSTSNSCEYHKPFVPFYSNYRDIFASLMTSLRTDASRVDSNSCSSQVWLQISKSVKELHWFWAEWVSTKSPRKQFFWSRNHCPSPYHESATEPTSSSLCRETNWSDSSSWHRWGRLWAFERLNFMTHEFFFP